jgi:hypothetical protein
MSQSAGSGQLVPYFRADEQHHRRVIATWATEVNKGHIQNTGTVTLGTSTAQTVVVDSRASPFSFIAFMPLTAKALSAGPTVRVSSQTNGTFTITHGNSVSNVKTFRYCLLG